MKEKECFLLFSNCIPVKGAARTAVCDLQTGRIRFLPNLLYDVLFENRGLTIETIKAKFNNQYDEGIDAYITVLVEEDFGHCTTMPESFPQMEMNWDCPSKVTNAILDVSAQSNYSVGKAILELNELGCQAIQFRFFYSAQLSIIENILSTLSTSGITCVEILYPYSDNHLDIIAACRKKVRVKALFFHGSNEDIQIEPEGDLIVQYSTEMVVDETHCGVIESSFFAANIPTFTESLTFNSCLNRKVGIDKNGEIKNCPSLKTTYGNISNSSISKAIESAEFQKIWSITKDQISICKVCEFRYVCTDCRAYVNDKNDPLSKPEKCSYDPFTTTWVENGSKNNLASL